MGIHGTGGGTKDRYLTRLMITLLIVITITVTAVSSILYLNFERSAVSQVNSYVTDNLLKACAGSQFMIDQVRLMLIQMFDDSDIRKILFSNAPDPIDIAEAKDRISSYIASSPFFRSIYIYNGGTGVIYFPGEASFSFQRQSFFDHKVVPLLDSSKKDFHMQPIPRIVGNDPENSVRLDHNVYTFIMYDNPFSNTTYNNAIVLNFSEDMLKHIISTVYTEKQGEVVIIDTSGRTMISSSRHSMLEDISNKGYIQKVLAAEQKQGSFTADIDGIRHLVTYVDPKVVIPEEYGIDWKFINIVPYNDITGDIRRMRLNTGLFLLLFLCIGIPAVVLLSRRLYAPVSKLRANIQKLEREKNSNKQYLKYDFLQKLLHGDIEYSEQDLVQQFEKHEINLDPLKPYHLVLLRRDDYNEFRDTYSRSERAQIHLSILDTVSKMFDGRSVEAIESDEDTITIIITAEEDEEYSEEEYRKRAEKVQHEVRASIGFTLSVTINIFPANLIHEIETIYYHTYNISQLRFFAGKECVLICGCIELQDESTYQYPYQKEKQFSEALLLKKLSEARQLFHEIIDTSRSYPYSVVRTTLLRIILALNSVFDTLKANSRASSGKDNASFSFLLSADTAEDAEEQLFDRLEASIQLFEAKKDQDHNELVDEIIEHIREQYTDPLLGIQQYADKYTLSPVYLGRIFKRHTSKSIAEYINMVRIEEAKKLLTETDKSVNEIVESIGFTYANYFYAIFKKYNGVTPTVFRQQNTAGSAAAVYSD
jgi:YesN/AraC family two-component response regulator